MAFFGMSDDGKRARRKTEDIGQELLNEGGEASKRSRGYYARGDEMFLPQHQRIQDQYDNGFGTPSQIRGWGQEAMPEVDETVGRQWDRFGKIRDAYGNIISAGDTMSRRGEAESGIADEIGREYTNNETEINDTSRRMMAREDDASGQVSDNINKTYGGLRDESGRTYGEMRQNAGKSYDTLINAAGDYYSGMRDRVGTQLDFDNAAAARSYAPARSASLRRMRAAGVDPNSVEASSIMGRVDAARGRSFDDNRSSNIDKVNSLWKGQLDTGSELMREKNFNDQSLESARLGNEIGLSSEQGGLTRGETLRHSGTSNDIDAYRSGRMQGVTSKSSDLTRDFYGRRADEALLARGLSQEDAGNAANLEREANSMDASHLDWKNNRFQTGMQVGGANQAVKQNAINGFNGLINTQYNQANQNQGAATQNYTAAYQPYKNIYDQEQQNAGWGTKMLVGAGISAAKSLAGTYVPGMKNWN
jgi:hypothetical protein